MELSQVLSWIGIATGMFIGIPQLVKTVRTRKAGDLSAMTFILILITCSCLLVRAIAITELAFMLYSSFLILINSLQLFLIWKYKNRKITG
jgi:MtN3 and saliva related transmembrane protein